MDKELVELFDAAKKAADAAVSDDVVSNEPEVTRCVDALKRLKDFSVTSDILISTQVGKRLRPLTKHPREKIKSAASHLLEIWKRLVIEETNRKKNGITVNSSSVKAEVSRSNVKVDKRQTGSMVMLSASETPQVEKSNQDKTVKVEKMIQEEKATSYLEKPSQAANAPPKLTTMIKCNDAMRDKMRELIAEALSKVADEADERIRDDVNACDPIRVAITVESVMFEKLGRSNGSQKLKYRSMVFNLKDPKNPDLRRKVLLGEVKPEKLVILTPEEMASDERQRENKLIKEKALFECQLGLGPKATTDQFKCGRCGQRKATYHQMQTRSADEPMTTYVTCVNCNHHWKFC